MLHVMVLTSFEVFGEWRCNAARKDGKGALEEFCD